MDGTGGARDAEELFRAFFDSAPIGQAIVAPDGSWWRVNMALAAMLGYSIEELQTTTFRNRSRGVSC